MRRQLVFREIGDTHHDAVVLSAADDLAGAVRVVSGRLPASCTPTRCEVALLLPDRSAPGAAAPQPPTLDPALGIVVVGSVRRADPLLLSGTFTPSPGAPLLIGNGVREVGALAALTSFSRTVGWVTPLDLARVKALGVPAWTAESTRIADEFSRAAFDELTLTAPTDVLRAQEERAVTSTQRFGLLAATGSVLLLAAAVVGGAALRRDHEAFTGALRRRGAAPRLLRALLAGEVAGAAIGGLVVGALAGAAAAAVVAARGGLPVAATTGAAVLAALPTAAWLTVLAACLLGLTVAVPAARDGAAARAVWHVVEAAALVCVAVAAVLVARGGVNLAGTDDTGAAAGGNGDPLLLALPVLVLAAAALALARLWLPLVRAAQRLVPRGAVGARLGLSAVTGRPLRPAATAALLTAAVATSVFAGAYRATLDRGATDQAAFAVPLDARVQTGATLRPAVRRGAAVRAGRGAARRHRPAGAPRDRLAPGERATRAPPSQLVGLDPAALPEMAAWGDTVGGPDPGTVAHGLAVGPLPQGVALPPGRQLRIATPGQHVTVAVTATVRAADGREQNVETRVVPAAGGAPAALVADLGALDRLPGAAATGRRLVALAVRLPTDDETRRVHGIGEGHARPGAAHRTPGARGGRGRRHDRPGAVDGLERAGLTAAAGGSGATVDYRLTQGAAVYTARAGGPGDAAATPCRSPSIPPRRRRRATACSTWSCPAFRSPPAWSPSCPGSRPSPDPSPCSTSAPSAGSSTSRRRASPSRGAVARGLRPRPARRPALRPARRAAPRAAGGVAAGGPVARGAAELLAWAAAATLLAGAAALVLLVAAERHDDAAAEYAWEADGVPPGDPARGPVVARRRRRGARRAGRSSRRCRAGRAHGPARRGDRHRRRGRAAPGRRVPAWGRAPCWPCSCWAPRLAAAAALAAASLREPLPRRRAGVLG